MLKTFNCGVGFCIITKKKNINKIKKYFSSDFKPYVIGQFIKIKKIKFYLMKKLDGKEIKNKIAVFISGRGSNLRSIIKYSTKKKSSYKVELVISNKKNAKGLLLAKKKAIKN